MSGRSVSVTAVNDEAVKAASIREALAEHDDPQLILDMIEGETDLTEAIAIVYSEIADDEAMVAGLKAKIEEFSERKARLEKANETRRNVILMAMEKAGLKTLKCPLATITVRDVPPSVVVTDEPAIPAEFWKPQDPKLDKKALAEAVKSGAAVPGAQLSNGGISLTIRKV